MVGELVAVTELILLIIFGCLTYIFVFSFFIYEVETIGEKAEDGDYFGVICNIVSIILMIVFMIIFVIWISSYGMELIKFFR